MASRAIFQHETGGHQIIDTAEAVRRPRMRKSRMREKERRRKKRGDGENPSPRGPYARRI